MGRYAIIKQGVITNIVESTPEFALEQGWIECPTHHDGDNHNVPVDIGHLHDGEIFSIPEKDLDLAWENIRLMRNQLLVQSDIMVLPDRFSRMNTETQQAWTTYRQELRDLPNTWDTSVFPTNYKFPLLPYQTEESLIQDMHDGNNANHEITKKIAKELGHTDLL
jgi:hypothetical protein